MRKDDAALAISKFLALLTAMGNTAMMLDKELNIFSKNRVMVKSMNEELEKELLQEIEKLKEIAKKHAQGLFGNITEFYDIKIEEETYRDKKVIEFYVNTDKGNFEVRKEYPLPTEEEGEDED